MVLTAETDVAAQQRWVISHRKIKEQREGQGHQPTITSNQPDSTGNARDDGYWLERMGTLSLSSGEDMTLQDIFFMRTKLWYQTHNKTMNALPAVNTLTYVDLGPNGFLSNTDNKIINTFLEVKYSSSVQLKPLSAYCVYDMYINFAF